EGYVRERRRDDHARPDYAWRPVADSEIQRELSTANAKIAALATCYCNDIYREAAKRKIDIESVEVEAEAEFEAEGEAASAVTYRACVKARASEDDIRALVVHADKVAEIQNTVRAPTPVLLKSIEAISVSMNL